MKIVTKFENRFFELVFFKHGYLIYYLTFMDAILEAAKHIHTG